MADTKADQDGHSSDLISQLELLLANASGPKPISMREIVVPFAILLFLRWLDQSKQTPKVIFENRNQRDLFTEKFRWETIRGLRGEQLIRWFQNVFINEFVANRFQRDKKSGHTEHIDHRPFLGSELQ